MTFGVFPFSNQVFGATDSGITESVQNSIKVSWERKSYVANSLEVAFNVNQTIATSIMVSYDVHQNINKTLEVSWSTAEFVESLPLTISYQVLSGSKTVNQNKVVLSKVSRKHVVKI